MQSLVTTAVTVQALLGNREEPRKKSRPAQPKKALAPDVPDEMGTLLRRSNRGNRRQLVVDSFDSESSDTEELTNDGDTLDDILDETLRARDYEPRHGVKLPLFTGKESWKVWYNRFQDVAAPRKWDRETQLDELLPRLQGLAGEFVYNQLPKSSRRNYKLLVQELGSWFRVIESSKTYGAQFSRRYQRPGESAEAYVAELKRLYDKAYGGRERKTRTEDLLRRFLDGLLDDWTSFQVNISRPQKILMRQSWP